MLQTRPYLPPLRPPPRPPVHICIDKRRAMEGCDSAPPRIPAGIRREAVAAAAASSRRGRLRRATPRQEVSSFGTKVCIPAPPSPTFRERTEGESKTAGATIVTTAAAGAAEPSTRRSGRPHHEGSPRSRKGLYRGGSSPQFSNGSGGAAAGAAAGDEGMSSASMLSGKRPISFTVRGRGRSCPPSTTRSASPPSPGYARGVGRPRRNESDSLSPAPGVTHRTRVVPLYSPSSTSADAIRRRSSCCASAEASEVVRPGSENRVGHGRGVRTGSGTDLLRKSFVEPIRGFAGVAAAQHAQNAKLRFEKLRKLSANR